MSQKSQDAIDVLSKVIVDTIDKKLGTAKFDKSQTGVVTAVNGNTYTIAVFGSQYNITSDQIFIVGQSVVVTALQGDMKRLVCSPDNVGTMKTVDSKVKVVGDQLSSFIDKDFADTVIRYTDVGKFFNIKDQIDTGASILWLKLKQASISDGTKFSFVCPEDVTIDARVCIENLITTIKTNPDGKGEYKDVSRAVYGPMMLFQAVTNEDGEDEPEDTSVLKKGRYYVIQYGEHWLNQASDGAFTYNFNPTTGQYEKEPRDPQVRYYPKQVYNEETKHYETKYIKYDPATDKETELSDPALLVESRVYFIGQSQSHAMTKFVDAMPSAEQIAADKIAEACDNLEYVVVNDPNRTDDLYNSRLTIDKIGRRNLVCSGSEYEGYTSDESAMTVCKYTLWKNCRLTDSITLNMHMIPWLDVNEKVKYAPEYLKSDAEKPNIAVEWIIKKIDKNIGEGTMNVTLSRYYPYYPYITYENVLKEKYTDNTAT